MLRPFAWATSTALKLMTLTLSLLLLAPGRTEDAPLSPWEIYNLGVRAYAGQGYTEALQRWQDLALAMLPRSLRVPVRFQLGNVQFRLGESTEAGTPEQTVEWWRRSAEAYRMALELSPRHVPTLHNLALVEDRLARLTHRLGLELDRAAEQQPLDQAVDLLQTSLEYLEEAATLAPSDSQILADLSRVQASRRDRLLQRATKSEAQGDREAARQTSWADAQAEQAYRAALDDLGQTDSAGRPAQQRVGQKLADLLARMGRREQQSGDEAVPRDPDEAIGHYETALRRYADALAVQPDHETAQRGDREVRAAMEALLVNEGRKELEQGREALARQSPQAVAPLTAALGNFESAQALNPDNADARAGAQEAQRLLPQALVLAGQRDLAAGERAEARSASEALGRYQDAETAFQQAVGLQPNHGPARQGLQEVEPRLARLRDRVAREAEPQTREGTQPDRSSTSLQDLLGQVNERDRDRSGDLDRQRQPGRKQTGVRRQTQDW